MAKRFSPPHGNKLWYDTPTAAEMATHGITVNAYAPGLIDSPMSKKESLFQGNSFGNAHQMLKLFSTRNID